ncbi:peptidoglycan editing factor PgeF [Faucicola atlantae]|uniref:peptidoglycan editing factor PgeF n=1 Tax=Faucicola atlantae TaxID=34059 RepID=UPI000B259005|nr:peptidoglycan editing factor PgeF [Moraxella atlantae]
MSNLQPDYLTLAQPAFANGQRVWVIQTIVGGTTADAAHPYGGNNVGLHVKDEPTSVHHNRTRLLNTLNTQAGINRISWLNQVHGANVVQINATLSTTAPDADAQFTALPKTALAIMTADCVPIVLTNADGRQIGAIHAGWQGLAKHVIASTVHAMTQAQSDADTSQWQAWIGACIAAKHYEVDHRVRDALTATVQPSDSIDNYLRPNPHKHGHYWADLARLAHAQLAACGITQVNISGLDSFGDTRFYSYRRQTQQGLAATGRMATLIAII